MVASIAALCMHNITTARSMLAMMTGIMLFTVSAVIDCWVGTWFRGMLVAVPPRESAGMHGIPSGAGGGDHSSAMPGTGRRGDPGDGYRAGSSRRGGGEYKAADGEEGRQGSDPD